MAESLTQQVDQVTQQIKELKQELEGAEDSPGDEQSE